jgi:hypothetical protein
MELGWQRPYLHYIRERAGVQSERDAVERVVGCALDDLRQMSGSNVLAVVGRAEQRRQQMPRLAECGCRVLSADVPVCDNRALHLHGCGLGWHQERERFGNGHLECGARVRV